MDYEWIGRESRKIKHEIIRKMIYTIRSTEKYAIIHHYKLSHSDIRDMFAGNAMLKEQIREVWKIYENENFWS